MPGLSEAIALSQLEVKKNGQVKTLSGRIRHFEQIEKNGKKFYTNSALRQAFNFKIQGFGADMIRKASVMCYNEARRFPEYKLKIIASVHDEVVFQCGKEYTEQCKDLIRRNFTTAVRLIVPVVCDVGTGSDYGSAK
jgi:DNA polymerase-1